MMRTLHVPLHYPAGTGAQYTLWPLFDLHIGAKAHAEDLLKADLARIEADPRALVILGGDMIDCINRTDPKRFSEETLPAWLFGIDDILGAEVRRTVDLMRPIASKIIAVIRGNHEDYALAHEKRDVYFDICNGIALASDRRPADIALGVEGFVSLEFTADYKNSTGGRWRLDIYAHHGYGGGRAKGGHALTLHNAMRDYSADIILMGHRHTYASVDHVTIRPALRKTNFGQQRARLAVFMPSYYATYISGRADGMPIDTYAQKKGLPPSTLGSRPIIIEPETREFRLINRYGHSGGGSR